MDYKHTANFVLTLMCLCYSLSAQIVQHQYFVPGSPYNYPEGIAAGPDGALWFADGANYAAYIGRMTMSGSVIEFPISYVGSWPYAIAPGADGNMWFTDQGTNSIGRICVSLSSVCPYVGEVTEYQIPTTNSYPWTIRSAIDGALWFVERSANNIARICATVSASCPYIGYVKEYPITTPNSGAGGITAGPDDALWFTEGSANQIGRICAVVSPPSCLSVGAVTEYATLTPNSGPTDITAGPDKNLWFTESIGHIGRITPSGQVAEYPANRGYDSPTFITAGPDGNLWFIDYYDGDYGSLGQMTPSGSFPNYYATFSWPQQLATGPDGSIWVADYYGWIVQAIPAARRNGVDLSASAGVPNSATLLQFAQAGVSYAVVEAPQRPDGGLAQRQLAAFTDAGFKTAAYCFLHFYEGQPFGDQQAQNCLDRIGGLVSSIAFVALDVEDETGPLLPLNSRLAIISSALAKLASSGVRREVIYTAEGYWGVLTGNTNQFSSSYPLWNGAHNNFEGYVDPAGNFGCAPVKDGAISLTPTLHGGTGKPSLLPFAPFGGWALQSGTQFDIWGTSGVAGACLFDIEVDFDVFDSRLFEQW